MIIGTRKNWDNSTTRKIDDRKNNYCKNNTSLVTLRI